jgi:DNA-directed RNA polymerase specialized sigma24 family protein
MNELDDKTLMRRLLDGDQAAFDPLFIRFRERGLRWLRAVAHMRDDEANDLTQEALINFWERRQKYDEHRGSPWMFFLVLLRYRWLDHCKARKNTPAFVPLNSYQQLEAPPPIGLPVAIDLAAIPGLSARGHEILLADALDPSGQIPNAQFATAAGITENAVTKQRTRAREHLRKYLEGCLPPDELPVLWAYVGQPWDALSYTKLAQKVGIGEHEFKTRLMRAFDRMQRCLKHDGSDPSHPDHRTRETGDR